MGFGPTSFKFHTPRACLTSTLKGSSECPDSWGIRSMKSFSSSAAHPGRWRNLMKRIRDSVSLSVLASLECRAGLRDTGETSALPFPPSPHQLHPTPAPTRYVEPDPLTKCIKCIARGEASQWTSKTDTICTAKITMILILENYWFYCGIGPVWNLLSFQYFSSFALLAGQVSGVSVKAINSSKKVLKITGPVLSGINSAIIFGADSNPVRDCRHWPFLKLF